MASPSVLKQPSDPSPQAMPWVAAIITTAVFAFASIFALANRSAGVHEGYLSPEQQGTFACAPTPDTNCAASNPSDSARFSIGLPYGVQSEARSGVRSGCQPQY